MNQLQKPSSDFSSVRDGRNAPDFYFDLDLSVVFDRFISIAGNSFYCDANPTDGNFVVYFQETDLLRGPTPFYASPGFIARIPFTQIRVVNTTAQAGKKARVVYGTDTDFQPGSVSQITLAGSVAITADSGFTQFIDANPRGLGATVNVFTAAANVNGAIARNMTEFMYSAVFASNSAFIAKATAPLGPSDGFVLAYSKVKVVNAGTFAYSMDKPEPVFVPAGLGLWYYNQDAQSGINNIRALDYKLL